MEATTTSVSRNAKAVRAARRYCDLATAALGRGALDRAEDLVDDAYAEASGLDGYLLTLIEAEIDVVSDRVMARLEAARKLRSTEGAFSVDG